MERSGRPVLYPPIYSFIDEYGDRVYRVELSGNQTVNIIVDCPGDPLSPEEALEMVHEMLREGIADGRFLISDFYPICISKSHTWTNCGVINRWGDLVYQVPLRDRTVTIDMGDEFSREEAHRRVRELLLHGLRDARYQASEFYPRGTGSQRLAAAATAAASQRYAEETYGDRCFGGTLASGEAIVCLPETGVKEGECGVCLEDFETGNLLRMMPCYHPFHEECFFKWLRRSHVCPLCRFPLPTV
ncbi:hypothetical protein EJB05_50929, partial [Eragrostis curvula]